MRVLAGDLGGTNARFVVVEGNVRAGMGSFESRRFAHPADAISAFLAGRKPPRFACLGIAGPVVGGRCVATNLPWIADERDLEKKTGIERVRLVNDLVAIAFGALLAPARAMHPLWGTRRPSRKGTLAVLAPGTGLGEAVLVHEDGRFVPLATEGSHVDFGARNDLEIELCAFLRKKLDLDHVSYERIVSGPGIGHLYDFFREAKKTPEREAIARQIDTAADRNAEITQLGLSGKSRAARRALELFASIYGAEAGNLALKSLSTGGVLLCGNITRTVLPFLRRSDFRASFLGKGRLRHALEGMPVAAIHAEDLGLKGAIFLARELASKR
jgi:glucokinase